MIYLKWLQTNTYHIQRADAYLPKLASYCSLVGAGCGIVLAIHSLIRVLDFTIYYAKDNNISYFI